MRNFLEFVRELVVRNWWLKVAGLALAYVLWLLVRSSEGERLLNVPLVVQLPRNMEIVSQRPATVEAAVLGVRDLTGNLPDLAYTINLQLAKEGEITVPLSPEGIRVNPGSGISVVHVNPARVTFRLEQVISKDLPVKVPVLGAPASGYDLYSVTCQPDTISVVGPRTPINALKAVATDPLSVAGLRHSFKRTANFDLPSDEIHTSPVSVEVSVDIGVHRTEHTVEVPVAVLGPQGYVATPAAVSVSVLVPLSFQGKLSPEEFRATAFVRGEEPYPNRVTVKPEVEPRRDLDPGIVISKIQPEAVTLTLKTGKK